MHDEVKSYALFLAGVALVLNPFVSGVHVGDGSVYRYDAAAVDYADGEGLELRHVRTGERLERLPVDDEILCKDRLDRRACRLESYVRQNGTVPARAEYGVGYPSRYEYVLLDGRFYRQVTVDRDGWAHFALDPVNDSSPLEAVAATALTSLERNVVDSGRVVSYRNLTRRNQLLKVDGEYYVVYRSGFSRYGGPHASCHSNGDGFCDAADWKRRIDTALTAGSRLLGLVLLLEGWSRLGY